MSWLLLLAGVLMMLAATVGVVLTAVTLPGIWFMLLAALALQWWSPGDGLLFNWWTLGVCAALAVLSEVFEFAASALGATRAGGSKRGALGAAVGSLAGALLGAPLLFPIGPIVGAVLGAAAGAVIAERAWVGKTWTESSRIGSGAAAGRLAASIVKIAIAGAIGVTLIFAVFYR